MKDNDLIFIISLPRSGSTFLQHLLSNNSLVNTCSESWILLFYANLFKSSLLEGKFNNTLATDAYLEYRKNFPEVDFDQLHKDFLLQLYKPLLLQHRYVIDKTPRYWEMLFEIRESFPQSKMVILKRNPLDAAKSMMKTWGGETAKEMLPYQRDLMLGPRAIAAFEETYHKNNNTYFLQYEELVKDIETCTKNLYAWLDIPFDPAVLELNNEKFKGKYGDPFLNSEEGYEKAKLSAYKKDLNKRQKAFLEG